MPVMLSGTVVQLDTNIQGLKLCDYTLHILKHFLFFIRIECLLVLCLQNTVERIVGLSFIKLGVNKPRGITI